MKPLHLALIAACTMLLATAGAHAFTVDDSTANNSDGSAKSGFTDPDENQNQLGGIHFSAQPAQNGFSGTMLPGQEGFAQPGFASPCGIQPCPPVSPVRR